MNTKDPISGFAPILDEEFINELSLIDLFRCSKIEITLVNLDKINF